MRRLAFLLSIVFCAPAAAQLTLAPADEDESSSGLVVHSFTAGFKPARPGLSLHGFRVVPESGAFVGYRSGNWLVGSSLNQVDDNLTEPGTALDFGAAYGVDINARQRLSFEGGVRFDLSSGLGLRAPHALAPGGDDDGLGLRMSWRYSFDQNRFVSTSVGFEQSLGGDRFDGGSPDRNGASFGTYFGYRY